VQQSERYDLLVQLYRDSNRWEDALAVAGQHDRLHLKNTYYEQAKHLESLGQVRRADCLLAHTMTHPSCIPTVVARGAEGLRAL